MDYGGLTSVILPWLLTTEGVVYFVKNAPGKWAVGNVVNYGHWCCMHSARNWPIWFVQDRMDCCSSFVEEASKRFSNAFTCLQALTLQERYILWAAIVAVPWITAATPLENNWMHLELSSTYKRGFLSSICTWMQNHNTEGCKSIKTCENSL